MRQVHGTQLLHDIVTHLGGILHKGFALDNIQHGQGSGTTEVVASEGGAQLSVDGSELGRNEHASHREAVADALGHGDHVGAHAQMLVGEELAGTAVAALYLVADEDGVVSLAKSLQFLQETGLHHADTAHTLYALDDDGAHVVLLYLGTPGFYLVDGQIGDMAVGIDGSNNLGIGGSLNGQRGAAMEGLLGREHTSAAVVERGQFQCVLVGLGTGVDEEQLIVLVA